VISIHIYEKFLAERALLKIMEAFNHAHAWYRRLWFRFCVQHSLEEGHWCYLCAQRNGYQHHGTWLTRTRFPINLCDAKDPFFLPMAVTTARNKTTQKVRGLKEGEGLYCESFSRHKFSCRSFPLKYSSFPRGSYALEIDLSEVPRLP